MRFRLAFAAASLALAVLIRAAAQTQPEPAATTETSSKPERTEGEELPAETLETESQRFEPLGLPSQQWSAVTVVHGLPSDTVRAVAQGQDGILWIGTTRGLARYDGRRIERPAPELSPSIGALTFDASGNLWVGTEAGAFVARGNAWEPVAQTSGHPIQSIQVGPKGDVLLASRNGTLFKVSPPPGAAQSSRVERVSKDEATLLQGPAGPVPLSALAADRSGWLVGSQGRGLLRFESGQVSLASGKVSPFFVNAVVRLDSKVYVGADAVTTGHGLFVLEESRLVATGPRTGPVTALSTDERGGLWVGTRSSGLLRLTEAGAVEHLDFASTRGGLRSDRVLSLFVDRDGVLWVGTDRGLSRFDPGAPRPARLGASPQTNFVHAVLRDSSGRLWAGTHRGLFVRGAESEQWSPAARFEQRAVYALFEVSPGRLLAGTPTSLEVREDNGSWRPVPPPEESPGPGSVRAIQRLGDTIYVARFGSGLEKLEDDRRTHVWPSPQQPEALRQVVSLSTLGDELWIGTASAGTYVLRGTDVRAAGFPGSSTVLWSAVSDEGDSVWAGTGSGLFHIEQGRPTAVLKGVEVRQVIKDGEGVWAATLGSGLVRVTRHPGGGFLSGRLGTDHGLPSDHIYALTAQLGAGRGPLVIGTNRGIALYEPARRPPGLRIVRVLSRRPHPPEDWGTLRLEHPQNSLLVEVSAIAGRTYPEHYQYLFSLSLPDGRSRSVMQRDPQFVADSLEPGHYRITARAFGTDLLPSAPQDLEFEVGKPPVPWVSIGLAVLLAISLAALGWGGLQNRRLSRANLALAETRLQLVNETETERRRIARDLHDQTLADLRRLLLRKEDGDPRGFQSAVESISTEIRRICEDLSPSVLENVGLRAALEWALELAVAQCPPEKPCRKVFRCPEELDETVPIKATVQIQVYRIVQEALANAVRHSGASVLSLDVEPSRDGGLRLFVTDNGSGFDISEAKNGRGLTNIRSRAALIGANVGWTRTREGETVFELSLGGRGRS